jgi:hypothetical protein
MQPSDCLHFYSHHLRSSYTVPEFAGTIPAVKERPKVTRRPTIPAPTTQQKQRVVKERALPKAPLKRTAEAKRGIVSAKAGPTMPAKKPLITKQAKAAAASPTRQAKGAGQSRWAPVAVGIALGSLAPAIYALAALWDPWGLRIVFPFVRLVGLREFGISHELARTLPQLMLYLQFPLEGLLVASNLRRGMKLGAAMGPIPGLHFVGALVLWIVALGTMPPI